MFVREIELKGHIIDNRILPKAFDTILELDGDYNVLEFDIGKRKTDISYAKMQVIGKNQEHLDKILEELQNIGAEIPEIEEVKLKLAEKDGVLPEGFYSTTNHPSHIKHNGEWIEVKKPKMDGIIIVCPETKTAETKVMRDIKKGDLIVVGHHGIRVMPPERPREKGELFEFMNSDVSAEKPKQAIVENIAKEMYQIREEYRKTGKGGIAIVGGPAIIHTGGGKAIAKLVKMGYIQALLAGNALATHDIESVLYGTSLGINIKTGKPVLGGHKHHLYAINEITKAGGIKEAVEQGILKEGIMYECVKNNVPFILAGSIRDDGPLPDVIPNVIDAQNKMRDAISDKKMTIMMATLLHSIATGNLMPSYVKTVCIDINSDAVTKLMDRGTSQAIGVVTDIGAFISLLVNELERMEKENTK